MKVFLKIIVFCCTSISLAQTNLELTPRGFATIEVSTPDKINEILIQAAKNWAQTYNKKGADIYDVTSNALSIDALRSNAYFYRNLGETFQYTIRYTLKINFLPEKKYTISFSVKEIYDNQRLLKMTVADFFTPEGTLKEDFEEVKPSLEKTANSIVSSFSNYIAR